MGINAYLALLLLVLIPFNITGSVDPRLYMKRSVAENHPSANFDYAEYADYADYAAYADYPAKYEAEYPIVVAKRAALLLDQLMIALQKVVDSQARAEFENNKALTRSAMQGPNSRLGSAKDEQTMDLQRRGQAKGRIYWRCYFNAVTCFKRK